MRRSFLVCFLVVQFCLNFSGSLNGPSGSLVLASNTNPTKPGPDTDNQHEKSDKAPKTDPKSPLSPYDQHKYSLNRELRQLQAILLTVAGVTFLLVVLYAYYYITLLKRIYRTHMHESSAEAAEEADADNVEVEIETDREQDLSVGRHRSLVFDYEYEEEGANDETDNDAANYRSASRRSLPKHHKREPKSKTRSHGKRNK